MHEWSMSSDEVKWFAVCVGSWLLLLCLISKEQILFCGDRKAKTSGQVQRARQGLRAVGNQESKVMGRVKNGQRFIVANVSSVKEGRWLQVSHVAWN